MPGIGGCEPDPNGEDTTGENEVPVRVHSVRPTTQDQVDAFMRQIKEKRQGRALPYPQYDELDLRNDPRGWQYGIRILGPNGE